MEVSAVGRGYQSWRKRFFSLERERTTVLTLRRCLVSLYHLSSGIPLHPSPSSFCLLPSSLFFSFLFRPCYLFVCLVRPIPSKWQLMSAR